jgi:hypothetical protein
VLRTGTFGCQKRALEVTDTIVNGVTYISDDDIDLGSIATLIEAIWEKTVAGPASPTGGVDPPRRR